MKKFIQRVQDLSQKAGQLKQAVEAAPGKAAQLRDTVLMTAGQLQQMRHDVQSSVMGLKADNEGNLSRALQEIHDHRSTFEQAGYALTGVDMELSPIHRLIVHLDRVEDVPESTLRSLLSQHAGQPTVYALLDALTKADAISERVRLSELSYRGVVVHVGPTPCVRLRWQADEVEETVAPAPAAATSAPAVTTAAPPPLPAFGSSSFFEQRSPAASQPATEIAVATTPAPPAAAAPVVAASVPTPATVAEPVSGAWKPSALDRFKKMPDVSKYRR